MRVAANPVQHADEPRVGIPMPSMVYGFGTYGTSGCDGARMNTLCEGNRWPLLLSFHPRFVAIAGTPIPMMDGATDFYRDWPVVIEKEMWRCRRSWALEQTACTPYVSGCIFGACGICATGSATNTVSAQKKTLLHARQRSTFLALLRSIFSVTGNLEELQKFCFVRGGYEIGFNMGAMGKHIGMN